jgi:hypothetical protein
MKHELKILPAYFEAVLSGEKTFEIRNNTDRGFQKGDTLLLREFDPRKSINDMICYTGRQTEKLVSYVSNFEQKTGFVVLGLKQPVTEADELRTCLAAATLEIADLGKDIENLRLRGHIDPIAWRCEGTRVITLEKVCADDWTNQGKKAIPLYAVQAPIVPEGWQLAPGDVTQQMIHAWTSAPNNFEDDDDNIRIAYRAMLAATPKLEGGAV